jgi:hypothetical protein
MLLADEHLGDEVMPARRRAVRGCLYVRTLSTSLTLFSLSRFRGDGAASLDFSQLPWGGVLAAFPWWLEACGCFTMQNKETKCVDCFLFGAAGGGCWREPVRLPAGGAVLGCLGALQRQIP